MSLHWNAIDNVYQQTKHSNAEKTIKIYIPVYLSQTGYLLSFYISILATDFSNDTAYRLLYKSKL